MRKRVRIALAVLLVAGLGVPLWQVLREREPVYQGTRLSVWLAMMSTTSMSGNPGTSPALRCASASEARERERLCQKA
jgi:hypothetical protein